MVLTCRRGILARWLEYVYRLVIEKVVDVKSGYHQYSEEGGSKLANRV